MIMTLEIHNELVDKAVKGTVTTFLIIGILLGISIGGSISTLVLQSELDNKQELIMKLKDR